MFRACFIKKFIISISGATWFKLALFTFGLFLLTEGPSMPIVAQTKPRVLTVPEVKGNSNFAFHFFE